jgi:hypothetical protein
MNYPGHIIRINDTDITVVKSIQHQLNRKGCGPIKVNGDFDMDTLHAVALFQTRYTDNHGNPLLSDGIVGPATWSALFGADSTSLAEITAAPNPLLDTVLDIARSQVGVAEIDSESHVGPEVYMYQDVAGVAHGNPWDMAFIYWCFNQASTKLQVPNPVYKTGDVIDEWCHANAKRIPAAEAKLNMSLVLPGQIFVISTGGGHGHSGIIEKNESSVLTTIEGNTCIGNNCNTGVYRRTARRIESINTGFIEFA